MSQRIKHWCYFLLQLSDNTNEVQSSSKTKPLFSSKPTPFSSMFSDDLDEELEDDLIEEEDDDAEMIRASSLFAKEVDGMYCVSFLAHFTLFPKYTWKSKVFRCFQGWGWEGGINLKYWPEMDLVSAEWK